MDALAHGGIDFADVNHTLEEEGIEKFIKSFDALLDVIAKKRRALLSQSEAHVSRPPMRDLRGHWRCAIMTCLHLSIPNTHVRRAHVPLIPLAKHDDDTAGGEIDNLNTNEHCVSNHRRMNQEEERR